MRTLQLQVREAKEKMHFVMIFKRQKTNFLITNVQRQSYYFILEFL